MDKLTDNFKLTESVGMFVVLQQHVTSYAEIQTFVIEAKGGTETFARPQLCYFTFYKNITVTKVAFFLKFERHKSL